MSIMKKQSTLIALVLVMLISACSGIKTASDQKAGVDFTQFTTYQLRDDTDDNLPPSTFNNEINKKRFESEMKQNLAERNLIENDNPDVYISYALDKEIKKGYSGSTIDMGGPVMWGRRGYYGMGMGTSTMTMEEYSKTIGQLTIAIVDADTNELLWYTSASGDINMNMKKVEKHVARAVEMVMADFPIDQQHPVSDDQIATE